MQKLKTFFQEYGALVVFGFMLIVSLQMCGTSSKLKSVKKELSVAKTEINQLDSALRKEIKVEGLRTSKRTLQDWNGVIRTTVRPDEQVKEYEKQIFTLENGK